ncbi:MAG TPA: YihY/virulence factor BrkB family protein [Stellaceae bacterium]|jgi:membrane protein|nr:YihY/virulence factor BrkB family protein [Stellaceae bacterium]
MHQGDGDRTYPHPLPRNSGEWRHLFRNIGREAFGDYARMTAAGLAFYSLLGIVPVLIALATFYGLVANPAAVQSLVAELRGFVPTQAANVLADSLKSSGRDFGFGIGFAVSLGFVLWTAQWASSGLITALNIVFDAAEQRSFLRLQLIALIVAIGGVLFILLAIVVVVLLPAVQAIFAIDVPYPLLLKIRWPLLALLFMFGLSALYSFAPSRPRPHWRWLNWGAVIATLLWIGASSAFPAYVSYAGSFDRFYGSLGGVAIFLFWLYLSGWVVILGAEIEAEIEAWRRGRRHRKIKRVLQERERHLASRRPD